MSKEEDIIGNMVEALKKFERVLMCHPDQKEALTEEIENDPYLRNYVTIIPSELVPSGTAYIMPKHQYQGVKDGGEVTQTIS